MLLIMSGGYRLFFLLLLFTLITAAQAAATTYTLNSPATPALCSGQPGFWNGNTYTCNWGQPFTLQPGDTVTSDRHIRILSYSGFNLTNTRIGSPAYAIDLEAQGSSNTTLADTVLYGSIYGQHHVLLQGASTINGEVNISAGFDASQSTASTVTGNVSASNGIRATNTTFHANLTSSNSGIELTGGSVTSDVLVTATTIVANGTLFQGTLTSTNGSISLTGGSAAGLIRSDCCTVKITGTNIYGGIEAKSGIDISGRDENGACISQLEIQGDITLTSLNPATLNCVKMTAGSSIGVAGSITFTDSHIGSANVIVDIETNGSANISLENSIIYGILTVPNYGQYSALIVADELSRIYGGCRLRTGEPRPKSIPESLCDDSGPPGTSAADYRFEYSPQALTCNEIPVTIRAYDSAGNPLTSGVNISLTPADMWLNGADLTFTSSTVAYLKRLPGGYTLGIGNASPAVSSLICSTPDCRITLHDSGFILDVPHLVAAEPANAVIKAVKTDDTTQQCIPGFAGGNRNILFSSSYHNPATGTLLASINNQAVSNTPQPVQLTFDSNATASFTVQYDDAGELALTAGYNGTDSEQSLFMTGSTNFITRPHTLAVTAAFAGNTANPATTDADPAFIAAGEDFSVIISAFNKQGHPTPNFGQETPRQQVATRFSSLVYPLTGADGSLSAGAVNTSIAAGNGKQQIDNVSWNEVGSIRLKAGLTANSYMGSGDVIATPESGIIGRFYPHHFYLASSLVQNSCQQFSYMSHNNLTVNYNLQARNKNANTLLNYHTGFYAGTARIGVVAYNAATALDYGRFSVNSSQWVQGEYQLLQTDAAFKRDNLPDGPYLQLQPGVTILSEKDNRQFLAIDLGDNAVKLAGILNMRYGRMILKNAYGPEDENLPLELNAEYWDGSRFVLNADDYCTPLDAGRVIVPGTLTDTALPLKDEDHVITGTTVQAAGTASTLQKGSSISNGTALLYLPAPRERGQGNMEYQLNDQPWLQYNWSGNATGNDENPAAHFIFGNYRGNPRQIFWRELF
ncbi:hypothetical protein QE250_13605 [Chromatiaceae bacterium AAb-1]|nr:hypothetical protein [Chromatiaceae bacterium AAb-1]